MPQDLIELESIGATIGSAKPASYAFSLFTSPLEHATGPVIQVCMPSPSATGSLLALDAQTANWVLKAIRKLESLGHLKRGWNSYDGLPLSPRARQTTFDALEWLKHQELPVPAVVLGSGGTVHLEWRSNDKELEFGFGDRVSEYLKVDSEGQCEEGEGADDEIREKLVELVEWLRNG